MIDTQAIENYLALLQWGAWVTLIGLPILFVMFIIVYARVSDAEARIKEFVASMEIDKLEAKITAEKRKQYGSDVK